MLESLSEAIPAEANSPWFSDFQLDWLDDPPKKKGKKERRHRKKNAGKNKYARLAFQYGALASRYDTLTRIVELSIAANRKELDDRLLGSGLTALGRPRVIALPQP